MRLTLGNSKALSNWSVRVKEGSSDSNIAKNLHTCQVISYSTTQITERLDQGRRVADQFSKIGMFLAGLAGVVAPMSLLTGFYGMNVKEFTSEATATLFDFWQIGIPIVLAAGLCLAFLTIWALTHTERAQRDSQKDGGKCSIVP